MKESVRFSSIFYSYIDLDFYIAFCIVSVLSAIEVVSNNTQFPYEQFEFSPMYLKIL